jgi:pSer/pThr/pTyr-binding forkhead associated (FHA) protein
MSGAPFLIFDDGFGRQVLVELPDGCERLSIGRRASSAVALTWDVEVSRLHAELTRLGGEWVLCDDGLSRNGSFVNGERLRGRRRLRGGDVLGIGATRLLFCSGGRSTGATRIARRPREPLALSPAQRRVLAALCRPLRDGAYAPPASNREIAEALVVSIVTVKGTLSQLFKLFGIDDLPQNRKRAALAIGAVEAGLVAVG